MKGANKMKKINQLILQAEKGLCKTSTSIASILPKCCRGWWYQPEEPTNLNAVLKNSKQNNDID